MIINKKNIDFLLILLHVFFGVFVFIIPFGSQLLNIMVLTLCVLSILLAKNKVLAVIIATGYIATSDVFFRMTGGLFFWELHKYVLILFVLMGLVLDKVKIKGYTYLIYIGLLLLSIVFTTYNYTDEIRKMIAFNLAGPVALGFVAFYFYKKKVSMQELQQIMLFMLLPIISLLVYLFLYSPSIKDSVTGTSSNFAASGGFGPNQVATILGTGIFILFTRLFLNKFNGIKSIIEIILLGFMLFRGLATFSRGGIITGLGAIVLLLIISYFRGNTRLKRRLIVTLFFSVILGSLVWFWTVNRTSGLIENRYANENAFGEKKEDLSTGRKDLFLIEVQAFLENPIFGIGVGKNKQFRFERTGDLAASHNEVSRLLAEHGILGILAFLILIIVPFILRLENTKNIFFYSFFAFWLLTINHSAMRVAFPSFIYGLCLLDIKLNNSTKTKKIVVSKA